MEDGRITKKRTVTHAFVLNEDTLQEIDDIFTKINSELTIYVTCDDDTTWHLSKIKDIETISRSRKNLIVSIRIRSEYTATNFVSLSVSGKWNATSIEYELTGSERIVAQLGENIDQIIDSMRPTLSLSPSIDFYLILIFGFSLGVLLSSTYEYMSDPEKFNPSTFFAFLGAIAFTLSIPVLRKYIFPRGVFNIGYYKKAYSRTLTARNYILVSLAGGIISSLLAAAVLSRL